MLFRSTPCYTVKQDSIADQEEDSTSQDSQKPPSPSGTDMRDPFQPETEIDHQLMVIRKEFTPDMDALGKEFDSEENRVKREAYRANHTKEQKIEVLAKWKEFMKEISNNVPFFEYFENHFEWHKKSCVITKTNWTTEDNKGNKKVVRSSHPPQEAILFNHRGSDIVASPFKHPTSEEKVVKKVIE